MNFFVLEVDNGFGIIETIYVETWKHVTDILLKMKEHHPPHYIVIITKVETMTPDQYRADPIAWLPSQMMRLGDLTPTTTETQET